VPKFMFGNGGVYDHFVTKTMTDYSRYFNYLIDAGYPLLIMAGEFDMQDGASGMPAWMKQTLTSLTDDFWTQERRLYEWFYADLLADHKQGG